MKNPRNKKIDELYDDHYYEWQGYGFYSENRSDHKRIIELLENRKKDKILEIGAGLGILLQRIDAKEKVGTETNDYAIAEGKKRGIKMIKNDAEKGMPFKPNTFDVIIMNEVIEHFKKPKPVLKECYKILKPGGTIIISTPAKSFFAHDLTESHFSEMTQKELRNLVTECGFKFVTQEVSGITFLYPILENVFFKPFRILRYFFGKKKEGEQAVKTIDSFHGFADSFILRPLNRYRSFLISIGQQQLVLAEKRGNNIKHGTI